jgi:hypothetical protein
VQFPQGAAPWRHFAVFGLDKKFAIVSTLAVVLLGHYHSLLLFHYFIFYFLVFGLLFGCYDDRRSDWLGVAAGTFFFMNVRKWAVGMVFEIDNALLKLGHLNNWATLVDMRTAQVLNVPVVVCQWVFLRKTIILFMELRTLLVLMIVLKEFFWNFLLVIRCMDIFLFLPSPELFWRVIVGIMHVRRELILKLEALLELPRCPVFSNGLGRARGWSSDKWSLHPLVIYPYRLRSLKYRRLWTNRHLLFMSRTPTIMVALTIVAGWWHVTWTWHLRRLVLPSTHFYLGGFQD